MKKDKKRINKKNNYLLAFLITIYYIIITIKHNLLKGE